MDEGNNTNGEEILGSSLTLEKVAAAKQLIENHYKNQMKSIQERKERYVSMHTHMNSELCALTYGKILS